MNIVILSGNLAQDSKLNFTQSGQPVCNLRMATNERFMVDGKPQERTHYHNLTGWGPRYEKLKSLGMLDSGQPITVEGRLEDRKWQGKDGSNRYSVEVVLKDITVHERRGTQSMNRSQPEGETPPPRDADAPDFADDEPAE